MKTNSKLFRGVLLCALIACFLCSVLVTGIGAGLTAKAEGTSLKLGLSIWDSDGANVWLEQTISGNGTYTFEVPADKLSALKDTTAIDSIKAVISDCNSTADAAAVDVTITAVIHGETDLALSHDDSAHKSEDWDNDGVNEVDLCEAWTNWNDVSAYTWGGTETVTVTVVVSGVAWPTDDTTEGGNENETQTCTATINVDSSVKDNGGNYDYCQFASCTVNGTKVEWTSSVKNAANEEVASVPDGGFTARTVTWDSAQVSDVNIQYGTEKSSGIVFEITDGDEITIYYDATNGVLTTTDPNPTTTPSSETTESSTSSSETEESSATSETTESTTVAPSEEPDFSIKSAGEGYTGFVMYDGAGGKWDPNGVGDTLVNGDGTYSAYFAPSDGNTGNGANVFCVDIRGFADAVEEQAGIEASDIKVSNVKIICDTESITVDQSKIVTGDIEKNGNLRIEIYNSWGGGATASNSPINTSDVSFSKMLKVEFTISGIGKTITKESTTTTTTTTATAGTTGTTAVVGSEPDFTVKSADSGYDVKLMYIGNGWWPNYNDGQSVCDGDGTYSVYFAGANNDPMVFCVDIVGFVDGLLSETDLTVDDIKVSDVKVICDTISIPVDQSKVNYGDLEKNGNLRIELYNVYGDTANAPAVNLDSVDFSEMIKVEFTISGVGTIGGASEEEEEEPKEEVSDSEGEKKEGGYVHDKGAIFVYTGEKYDINDFQFYGYAFFRVHQLNGTWGAWYDNYAALKGQGFYIKYWDDYKGIGYPAVQLSWDTDRAYYFSLYLRSPDYLINIDYNINGDGFWRGPAERIEGTGEAYLDGGNRWYYFSEGSYESAEEDTTTTQNPTPTTEGAINVTGDGEYYTFLAIGADNNKDDWYYSWAGVQKAEEEDDSNKMPPAGMTVEAVNAKIGEQFTISVKTETPVAYTWYVAPTIVVGADKTNVDAEVVAVRIDGKDVTDTINFAADEKTWWYEDTGIYNKANNDNKEVAARLAGGYNEWGTKYIAESPAGYTSIEYDIIINGIA